MRRADLSSCQCSACIREAHAPSSVRAQPDTDNPPNNRDTRSVHAQAEARGIRHFAFERGERRTEVTTMRPFEQSSSCA